MAVFTIHHLAGSSTSEPTLVAYPTLTLSTLSHSLILLNSARQYSSTYHSSSTLEPSRSLVQHSTTSVLHLSLHISISKLEIEILFRDRHPTTWWVWNKNCASQKKVTLGLFPRHWPLAWCLSHAAMRTDSIWKLWIKISVHSILAQMPIPPCENWPV